jgi:pimeloyl-ACP methyl ester carboxylesterase
MSLPLPASQHLVTEKRVDVPGGHLAWAGFGSPDDPVVLLIAGQCQSMTWWDADFCRRLAAEGRYVVRYDHRDTGRSSTDPAGRPTYSGRDLVLDPIRLLDGIDVRRAAHIVGLSMGGGIAQDLALARSERLASLTLVDTSPVSATTDGTLPPPEPALRQTFENPEPTPDWSDRDAVIDYRVAIERPYAGAGGLDEERYRRLAAEEVDRSTDMEATLTNHPLVDDWSPGGSIEEISLPTLVLHGSADPLFPLPHGEALRDAIPGARLVVLDGGGHQQPPPAMWDLVVGELAAHTA